MSTMYAISEDLLALNQLLDSLVDENGDPRGPTDEELETMKKWFDVSMNEFNTKFDNYCKFIKNLKISAENIDAERKSYKDELDRLRKRAKASENKANAIQNLLYFAMQKIGITKHKTELFTATEQNTQINIFALQCADLKKVPDEFLKPRELDTSKIKQAIKDGEIIKGEGINETKLYVKVTGEELKDVRWTQGKALVIR